ncbi:MAG: hypothetical protein P4M11_09150, partial [Candidatus Pacebacteria bacterium]|nr:hypothetical protein [Candidatus Paceibacterota bacterium]
WLYNKILDIIINITILKKTANMDAALRDAFLARSIESEPESDLFSALCGLTNFVTNSKRVLKIGWELTPAEVSVLCSLIQTSAVSRLALKAELPLGVAAQLGFAIKHSTTLHTISLGRRGKSAEMPGTELFRMLNLAASPALEQLSIINFSTETEWPVCDQFEKFTSLRSFTISACSTYPTPLFIAEVGKLRALESLCFRNPENICDSDFDMLVAKLKDLPLLSKLSICCDWKAGRQIGSLIAQSSVRELDLNYSDLRDEGVCAMVDRILFFFQVDNCKLQQLNLRMSNIGLLGALKVAKLVAHSPRLRALDLSCNRISRFAVGDLFDALRLSAQSLEVLDVSKCDLGPRGPFSTSMGELRTSLALRVLGFNDESGPVAHALAQLFLFSGGCRLINVGIQSSGITETGALELAGALAKAYALRWIDISKNPLGPRGAAAIIDALATTCTVPMDTIDFGDCDIRDDGASAAGRLIMRRGCRGVLLYNNEMHATGAKAIMDSVAVSTACVITLLVLSDNPIEDEGVKCIFDRMMQTRRVLMHELYIENIDMGVKAATAIKLALIEYGVTCKLHLSESTSDMEANEILQEVNMCKNGWKSSRVTTF